MDGNESLKVDSVEAAAYLEARGFACVARDPGGSYLFSGEDAVRLRLCLLEYDAGAKVNARVFIERLRVLEKRIG